jgi:hypothetical protein
VGGDVSKSKTNNELKILRHAMAACRVLVVEDNPDRLAMVREKIRLDVQAYDVHLQLAYGNANGQANFLGSMTNE